MAESKKEVSHTNIPKYGIFGPTRSMKYCVDLNEIKPNSKGAVFEFCTEELNENFENLVQLEEKYFDGPDMMKCSYLLNDLGTNSEEDDDDSLPSFQKLRLRMKNVTEDGGVKGLIISEGVGAVVAEGSHVQVHYHAFLEDMVEPYDSTYLQGKALQITLGMGMIIPGLDLGISTMRKKEKKRFLISPEYAYGAMGCPPRIPPNATILFEVELISYTKGTVLDEIRDEDRKRLPFKKMLSVANAEKNEGIILFKQSQYSKAMRRFMNSINAIESANLRDEAEETEMIKVASKAYQNMALCCLKLGNYGKALAAGKRVLEYDPEHPKALYIAGKALRHIGDFNESRRFMLQALKFAPGSADVVKELKLLDRTEARFRADESEMYKKMFEGKKGVQSNSIPAKHQATTESNISDSFQKILKNRLTDFMTDESMKRIDIPISTFTQKEIYYVAEAADEMGFQVDLIDKPGKPKLLKIVKQ